MTINKGSEQPRLVQRIARKVIDASCEPFDIDAKHLQIGGNVGYALNCQDCSTWHELIELADEHFYRAKATGRGGFVGEIH